MKPTKTLSHWELIKLLRHHSSLSSERIVDIKQKKFATILGYVLLCFAVFYLMFFALMLSLLANSSHRYTASETLFGVMPFILAVDFFMRFSMQQTPAQLIKPYVLQPISKYACIDCFLFNSATNTGNLVWLALFVPFAIMSIVFVEGFWAAIGVLLAAQLLILANCLWYVLSRTLINTHWLWWLLPAAGFALLFSPWYIGSDASFSTLFKVYGTIGDGAAHWSVLTFGGILLLIALLVYINRRVQYASVYNELAKTEKTTLKHVTQLSQLDRFGRLGEYLKLELKSIMRNKNIRKGFITANIIILMFSLLISFTDVYDGGMTKFLAVYNFAIYGAIVLVKVMSYEGNYIDCLMVHKENIITLLQAKYIIYGVLLLIPMLLMLPTVFMGKCSLAMLIALMLLTAGPVHASFLYMAIINKQTMPLNTKFIGKGSLETNYLQIVVEIAAFTLPLILLNFVPLIFGDTAGPFVLMLIGIAVIATQKYWIGDIYRRLMRRRYDNMESFRATR